MHGPALVRITAVVSRMLAKRGAAAAAADQTLRDAGLTSLDMVNLMLAVEEEFDLFIPQEAMTPDNFRTIAAINALVLTLAPGA